LESAPVLLRRPHRDTGGGKTVAKSFARASSSPICHVVALAKMEAARSARTLRKTFTQSASPAASTNVSGRALACW
jgi:hypothetical protein